MATSCCVSCDYSSHNSRRILLETIHIINIDPLIEIPSMSVKISQTQIHRFREERILSICKQSKEHGFAVKFWEGVVDKRGGFYGINQSFKNIVAWAKEQKLKYVFIGEDDLTFSSPGAWQYFLDNMPEEFDIYSGGIYSGHVENGRILTGYSGNTLIVVHENFYDTFLAIRPDNHLDRELGMMAHKKNFRIVEPFVVYQIQGYSDNHRRETKHESYLEKMKLFGRGL